MKILFASATPLAGVCELNCRLVNELYPGVHEARVLNNGPGRHGWYTRPGVKFHRYSLKSAAETREALLWADHVCCQAAVGPRNMNAMDLLKKKTWSWVWHGCEQNGCLDRSFAPEDYKHVRFLHIDQGWIARQADYFARFDLRVVPNLITIDDEIHRAIPWGERIQRVAFSPSNTKAGAPNDKGVELTEREFKKPPAVPLKVLLRRPFEDCMREKQRSVLGIDEVVTPSYHRSGLEFLSQGTPCLCSVGPAAERALKDATGADELPFTNVGGPASARAMAEAYFRLEPADQEVLGQVARAWIERYYAPRSLLERHYLPVWTGG